MIAAGASTPANISRSLVWRRLDEPGLEFLQVTDTSQGPALTGRIVAVEGGRPLTVDYSLHCDADWRARDLDLTQTFSGQIRRFQMARVEADWWVGGRDRPELGDCSDIDLALSPATNALPVNRLHGLEVGSAAEIVAAWVLFPSLEIRKAAQRYERLAERRWRFTSVADGFTAEIDVDDAGLPVDYQGGWTRVAEYRAR